MKRRSFIAGLFAAPLIVPAAAESLPAPSVAVIDDEVRNLAAQKAFNYWRSSSVELLAIAPRPHRYLFASNNIMFALDSDYKFGKFQ